MKQRGTAEFTLNEQVKRNIEKSTGLSVKKISSMSSEKVDRCIEKKIGKKLHLNLPKDKRLEGRGSVYLSLKRLMSISKADKKLAKL